MLKLDETTLEVVSGGHASLKIKANVNYMSISANNNEVEKGGTMVFSITQFNGKQINITPAP